MDLGSAMGFFGGGLAAGRRLGVWGSAALICIGLGLYACWARLGFSGWAWPVFESNVIFGFFRPIWVMGFGLFRRASSQMVFLIDFLSILGLDLGLVRRLLCEHDVVSLLRLIL